MAASGAVVLIANNVGELDRSHLLPITFLCYEKSDVVPGLAPTCRRTEVVEPSISYTTKSSIAFVSNKFSSDSLQDVIAGLFSISSTEDVGVWIRDGRRMSGKRS